LLAIFRDEGQDRAARAHGDRLALAASYVYRSFDGHTRAQKRWVYVRDTEEIPADKAYRDRAREGGFRTILAFPLRAPFELNLRDRAGGAQAAASIRGFLSFDAEDPGAFLGLFHTLFPKGRVDNEGRGLKPREEIQAFYGLADSIATMAMLKERVTAKEGTTT
jgi:hypothetical protein